MLMTFTRKGLIKAWNFLKLDGTQDANYERLSAVLGNIRYLLGMMTYLLLGLSRKNETSFPTIELYNAVILNLIKIKTWIWF